MKIKNMFLWLWMLTKRLYKKTAFLVVLVLIPLLAVGYGLSDMEEGGVISIAVTQEGEDSLATTLIDQLCDGSQLVRYVRCQDPQTARQLLEAGKVDAVWIFPEQLQERIDRFGKSPAARNAFVTVLERQSSVATKLTREALGGVLYAECSQSNYLHFVRNKVAALDHVTDQQLLDAYAQAVGEQQLFVFTDLQGNSASESGGHFLLTPVRGLLAVVILLSALAAGMYYSQDIQRGTFHWVPGKRLPAVELGCQMISVTHVAVFSALALALLGLTGRWWQELLALLLYSLCAALFGMVIRRACGKITAIGVLMPVLVVICLVVCPVFLDLQALYRVQLLLPPTYYIFAGTDVRYLLYMIPYAAVLYAIYWLLGKIRK